MPDIAPRATVAIPFHEVDSNMWKAVTSVLNQTETSLEILLMNDGAPREFGDAIQALDPQRIRHYWDGENRGLATRLNESIALASAQFYFRMDSDDIMHPSRVSSQLFFLETNPAVMVLGTSAWIIDDDDTILGMRRASSNNKLSPNPMGHSAFIHPSVAFRTSWIRQHGYDQSLSRTEDKELWVRAFKPGIYAWLDEPLLFYRVPRRQSARVIKRTAEEERRIVSDHVKSVGRAMAVRYFVRSISVQALKSVIEYAYPKFLAKRRYSEVTDVEKYEAAVYLDRAIRS